MGTLLVAALSGEIIDKPLLCLTRGSEDFFEVKSLGGLSKAVVTRESVL